MELSFPEKFNAAEYFVDQNVTMGRGDKTAIYFEEEKISYKEVLDSVIRTGNALRSLGIGLEDRVLLLLFDSPESLSTAFLGP